MRKLNEYLDSDNIKKVSEKLETANKCIRSKLMFEYRYFF